MTQLISLRAKQNSLMGLLIIAVSLAPPLTAAATTAVKIEASDAVVDAAYEPDYAKGIPERREWHRLRKIFLKKKLPLILRKHRDKLRCKTCIEAYMDVSFSVSLTGSVNIRKVDAESVCGVPFPPAMRDEFFAFLKDYPYPKLLLGKTVRLRLGTAFKCGVLAGI